MMKMDSKSVKIDDVDLYEEFGVIVKHRNVGVPNKNKIIHQIPFSNDVLDFSDLYGGQTFEERNMTYSLNLCPEYRTSETSELPKVKLTNFLMQKKKFKLHDDVFPGYYFLAEMREGTNFDQNTFLSELTITFTAYPFMIKELPEGDDIWDTFNFELDVAQFTTFDIQGSQSISLINNGTPDVVPKIIASHPFTIIHDGKEFKVNAGTSEDLDFVLSPGANRMTIRGTGRIEFLFHQELI